MTRLPLVAARSTPVTAWRANPFLHLEAARIYDPLADRGLAEDHPAYARLRELVLSGATETVLEPALEPLAAEGWLVDAAADLSRRFRLKYLSLEAHTICNQACYYCPVSLAPRESYFMPTSLYERIVREVAELGEPVEAVVMISYNEPTVDPRFVDQVRVIKDHGLPPAVLTNGSGLTPKRVDAILEMGGLCYFSVNISTLDREAYRRDRGKDHLPKVLANLEYVKDKPLAPTMDIVVLGEGDDAHRRNFEELRERFSGSRFNVRHEIANDRAGYLEVGLTARDPDKRLCGCELVGSRPLQHLHVTARGTCILCCQDYREQWVVGDLATQTVREVLEGEEIAKMRRWVYGLEEPPDDFICNGCHYALKR